MIKNHTKGYHDLVKLMKELGANTSDAMQTMEALHQFSVLYYGEF